MLLSTGKLCLNFLVPAHLLSHTCTFESKKLLANLLQCLTPILNNKQTCFFLPDFLSTLAHLTALFSLVNDKHPTQFSVALIRPTTMATYRRKIWGLWSQRDKRPSPSWQGNAATNSMHSDRNSWELTFSTTRRKESVNFRWREGFETSKTVPSDTLPLARIHLLALPK